MSTTLRMRPRAARRVLAVSALLGLGAGQVGLADQILVAQTNMISGTVSTVDSFSAPGTGTMTIELSNIPWPTTLSSLSFFAGTASQVLASGSLSSSTGPQLTESFQVTPGTYFAHVTGTAPSGPLDLGLYSMQVSFAPAVPLPAAAWLLAGGLLVLGAVGRRLGFLRPVGAPPAAT